MNPFAKHFSAIKASDLVLVDSEGYVTEGGAQLPINEAGFMIHSEIHKARPDVIAAAHTHSVYGKTWSAFGKPIEMLTQGLSFSQLVKSVSARELIHSSQMRAISTGASASTTTTAALPCPKKRGSKSQKRWAKRTSHVSSRITGESIQQNLFCLLDFDNDVSGF